MTAPIRIVLELTPTGRWRALLGGTKLLVTSKEPLRSAARVLLGEGLDPETVLEVRHKGSDAVADRVRLRDVVEGWPLEGGAWALRSAGSPRKAPAGGPGPGARPRPLGTP